MINWQEYFLLSNTFNYLAGHLMNNGSPVFSVSDSSQWWLPIEMLFYISAFTMCASLHFVKQTSILRITHHVHADAANWYLSTVDLKRDLFWAVCFFWNSLTQLTLRKRWKEWSYVSVFVKEGPVNNSVQCSCGVFLAPWMTLLMYFMDIR